MRITRYHSHLVSKGCFAQYQTAYMILVQVIENIYSSISILNDQHTHRNHPHPTVLALRPLGHYLSRENEIIWKQSSLWEAVPLLRKEFGGGYGGLELKLCGGWRGTVLSIVDWRFQLKWEVEVSELWELCYRAIENKWCVQLELSPPVRQDSIYHVHTCTCRRLHVRCTLA